MYTIPTTQQSVNQALSYIQGQLNQTTPPSSLAFNNVLATVLSMIATSEYKYMAYQILGVLWSTAVGAQLDALGSEYGLPRNQAQACQAVITIPGTPATAIPQGTTIVDTSTGALYTTTAASVIGGGGTASASMTAQIAGTSTSAVVGDVCILQGSIAGVSSPITVASVTVIGSNQELDSAYRIRGLAVVQAVGGGSNAADVAIWAQSVPGVVKAYAYGGLPFGGLVLTPNEYAAQLIEIIGSPTGGSFILSFNGQLTAAIPYGTTAGVIATAMQALTGATSVNCTSIINGTGFTGFMLSGFTVFAPVTLSSNNLSGGTNPTVYVFPNAPPARSVFVQCSTSINAQGIPPASLLAQVTSAIQYNAAGISNQPLGITMDELFVMPITCTGFYVTITTLNPGNSTAGVVQAAVTSALASYFAIVQPFVDGVTPIFSRNDLITQPSVTAVVQTVLAAYGASCAGIGFGMAAGSFLLTYQLGEGECAQLSGVTWQ